MCRVNWPYVDSALQAAADIDSVFNFAYDLLATVVICWSSGRSGQVDLHVCRISQRLSWDSIYLSSCFAIHIFDFLCLQSIAVALSLAVRVWTGESRVACTRSDLVFVALVRDLMRFPAYCALDPVP